MNATFGETMAEATFQVGQQLRDGDEEKWRGYLQLDNKSQGEWRYWEGLDEYGRLQQLAFHGFIAGGLPASWKAAPPRENILTAMKDFFFGPPVAFPYVAPKSTQIDAHVEECHDLLGDGDVAKWAEYHSKDRSGRQSLQINWGMIEFERLERLAHKSLLPDGIPTDPWVLLQSEKSYIEQAKDLLFPSTKQQLTYRPRRQRNQ
ncbi:hypothetical protein OIU34_21615 [Pararhizobium sp. BT-229]|uniref:hypothetical protein n=1 Tax=Pararhizobium sp. BT-229 TaxID=2986923 RepID=UPI0021F780ED|nr:hypothetical protein [Pararhizobium sp. BT-229]MCV9964492.1 hypothetical protein [Pararhizobium sp. BT-229]